jgi:hypothetical protein
VRPNDYFAHLCPNPQQQLAVDLVSSVSARALGVHRESGQRCRPNVPEFKQHPVSQALDDSSAKLLKHDILDKLTELKPATDYILFVPLDEAHRFDNVDDYYSPDATLDFVLRGVRRIRRVSSGCWLHKRERRAQNIVPKRRDHDRTFAFRKQANFLQRTIATLA